MPQFKGHLKDVYLRNIRNISVYHNEIVKVAEVQDQIKDTTNKEELLSKENERLNERCEVVWTGIGTLKNSKPTANLAFNSKQKELEFLLILKIQGKKYQNLGKSSNIVN